MARSRIPTATGTTRPSARRTSTPISDTSSPPGIETRFYAGIYLTDQKLPGTLSLFNALNNPTLANASVIAGNQSRKVETERIANRTSFALDVGKLDIDTWAIHKSL